MVVIILRKRVMVKLGSEWHVLIGGNKLFDELKFETSGANCKGPMFGISGMSSKSMIGLAL